MNPACCCMPLTMAPANSQAPFPGSCPPRPRGNCCPSFWPPMVYQPPAQKICVIVNNCPSPKPCGNPCCPAFSGNQRGNNNNNDFGNGNGQTCGQNQNQNQGCGNQPQNCGYQQQNYNNQPQNYNNQDQNCGYQQQQQRQEQQQDQNQNCYPPINVEYVQESSCPPPPPNNNNCPTNF